MKKNNNKGFMLLETLVVSSFIITILIYLYVQFVNLKSSYDTSFKYDTIPNMYGLKQIDKFINNNYGYEIFKTNLNKSENNNYLELYKNKCDLEYFSDNNSYCNKLMDSLNVKTLIITNNKLKDIKTRFKEHNPYSNGFYRYLKSIDPVLASKSYLLIAEFNDGTYGMLKLEEVAPICKRATALHTEKCNQTTTDLYCSGFGYHTGDKITYGNLGTKGTLNSGDAFDCDVNGDGKYDSKKERFYYVSDYYNTSTKEFEDDTAVLVYYSNVKEGLPNNSFGVAYDSSGENWHGPRTAIHQLPTTSQWKNVSLKNNERAILNINSANTTGGGNLPSNFSYKGYAARLLTTQEINNGLGKSLTAAGITGSDKKTNRLDNIASYLYENTAFASSSALFRWRLETATVGSESYTLMATESTTFTNGLYGGPVASVKYGVRPAIDVNKNDINY